MARTVPVYAFQAADGSTIRFAADSDFWITNLTGEDGLDVEMTEQQSTGQTGKIITGQSIGSRSLTVTGSILRDLDANEALLKRLVRPKEAGRFLKTVGDTTWYLEVLPSHTPDVSGGEHLLNFQFKLKASLLAHRRNGSHHAGRPGGQLVPDPCLDRRQLVHQQIQKGRIHHRGEQRQH